MNRSGGLLKTLGHIAARFEGYMKIESLRPNSRALVLSPMDVRNLDSGAARRIYHLSDNLARCGNKVTVICMIRGSERNNTRKFLSETKNKAKIIVIPFVQLLLLPSTVLRHCIKADIVQMEFPTFSPFMFFLRLLGKPVVLDEHGVEADFTREVSEALEKPVSRFRYIKTFFLEWLAVRLSTVIFTCSVQDAKRLQIKYKAPREKLVVIPNGVDDDFFNHVDPNRHDKPMVIFVGNFDHAPNVYAAKIIVNEIAASVHKGRENLFFALVGRNPPEWLNKSKDQNYVKVFGNVKDVRSYLAAADVAIAPIYHGSGTRIKILEYMAFSKPVVSTSKGVEGLDVEDGKHMLIRNAPEEFAQAIIDLLFDQQLAKQIGKNSQELAFEKYQWKDIAKKVTKVYEELTN